MIHENPRFSTVTILRDMFYGYDILMENVSDPSHIDFAHHKVTGWRELSPQNPIMKFLKNLIDFIIVHAIKNDSIRAHPAQAILGQAIPSRLQFKGSCCMLS